MSFDEDEDDDDDDDDADLNREKKEIAWRVFIILTLLIIFLEDLALTNCDDDDLDAMLAVLLINIFGAKDEDDDVFGVKRVPDVASGLFGKVRQW